jgi:hypothetical protein
VDGDGGKGGGGGVLQVIIAYKSCIIFFIEAKIFFL